jgi:hypothetical protein
MPENFNDRDDVDTILSSLQNLSRQRDPSVREVILVIERMVSSLNRAIARIDQRLSRLEQAKS